MSLIRRLLDSTLFKSAFIYGVSSALNAALPLLLLPFLTRYLSPADYGFVTTFTTLNAFFNVFVGLNVNGAVFNRYFFSKSHTDFNFSEYLSNAIVLIFFSSLIVLLITFVFQSTIIEITQLQPGWLFIGASTAFFQAVILIVLALFQSQQRPLSFGLVMVVQSALNVLSTLVLVILFDQGWSGRNAGISLGLYVAGAGCLFYLIRHYQLKFNMQWAHIKSILKFGLPLLPHTLGALLISLADRFIIAKKIGIHEAGLYQVGIQISMVILFFTEAFNKAYSPWLYDSLNKNSSLVRQSIVKFTYIYFGFIILVALLISLIPEWFLVSLLGPKYTGSQQFIFWSALAFAFNGMYLMVCNYIYYTEKNKYLSYISLPTGILNLSLSWYLVDRYGAIGAAQSMCAAYGVMFLLTWYRASKLVKMPWFKREAMNA